MFDSRCMNNDDEILFETQADSSHDLALAVLM
jgi:hypothetical protein